jgi:hypothetical protein
MRVQIEEKGVSHLLLTSENLKIVKIGVRLEFSQSSWATLRDIRATRELQERWHRAVQHCCHTSLSGAQRDASTLQKRAISSTVL